MRKYILITGGAGYIGSKLSHLLFKEGKEIAVIDKGVFGFEGLPPGVKLLNADLLTIPEKVIREILEDTHTIIHLAGISTEPTAQINPRMTDIINHVMTVELAKMAKLLGVSRFIFASSASVYFSYDTPLEPFTATETDKVNPISAYALSKRAAELGLLELQDNNFQPIIFRCGTVHGPSPRQRLDLVLNSFVKNSIKSGKMYVHCNGKIYRPMIDIVDLCEAYNMAIDIPLTAIPNPPIINVNSSNNDLLSVAGEVKVILSDYGVNSEIIVEQTGIARNYMSNNDIFKKIFFNDFISMDHSIRTLFHYIRYIPFPDDIRYYNDKVYMERGL